MARLLRVYLEKRDLERLDAWARKRGWTKSQAVRVAVRALTRRPAEGPLIELSGHLDDLPADLSVAFHRHLDETEPPAPFRACRRRPGTPVRR